MSHVSDRVEPEVVPPSDESQPASPLPVEAVSTLDELAFAASHARPGPLPNQRAGPLVRVGVAMFDYALFGVGLLIAYWLLYGFGVFYWLAHWGIVTERAGNVWAGSGMAVAWLLYTASEVVWVGTPGKRLLGLRISNLACGPSHASQRLLRWVLRRLPDILGTLAVLVSGLIEEDWLRSSLRPLQDGLATASLTAWPVLLISFLAAGGRSKLAVYDRIAGTGVVPDEAKQTFTAAAFEVVSPPYQGEAKHQAVISRATEQTET